MTPVRPEKKLYLDKNADFLDRYFSWHYHKSGFIKVLEFLVNLFHKGFNRIDRGIDALHRKEKMLKASERFSGLDWLAFRGALIGSIIPYVMWFTLIGGSMILSIATWVLVSAIWPFALIGGTGLGLYLGVTRIGWSILCIFPGVLGICALYVWGRKPPEKPEPESSGPYR